MYWNCNYAYENIYDRQDNMNWLGIIVTNYNTNYVTRGLIAGILFQQLFWNINTSCTYIYSVEVWHIHLNVLGTHWMHLD